MSIKHVRFNQKVDKARVKRIVRNYFNKETPKLIKSNGVKATNLTNGSSNIKQSK